MVQPGGWLDAWTMVEPRHGSWPGWLLAGPHRHVPWGHQESSTGVLLAGWSVLIPKVRTCPSPTNVARGHVAKIRYNSGCTCSDEDVVFHQNGEHLTNLW